MGNKVADLVGHIQFSEFGMSVQIDLNIIPLKGWKFFPSLALEFLSLTRAYVPETYVRLHTYI